MEKSEATTIVSTTKSNDEAGNQLKGAGLLTPGPVLTQLDCGHELEISSDRISLQCPVLVRVTLPCDHTIEKPCHRDLLTFPCPQPCDATMKSCGHGCLLKCHIRKDPDHLQYQCKKKIALTCQLLGVCGHTIKEIECYQSRKGLIADDPDLLKHCSEPCGVVLKCGHQCTGNCGECFQGRFHKRCSSVCGVPMVCNHLCRFPCSKACRSCVEPCTFKCAHGQCDKLCGELCTPCTEPCIRRCPHSQCSSTCSQPCQAPPCNEPCEQLLKCGHKCTGFCGDPCLSRCKECHPEDFEMFFGTETESDVRFVQLQDCLHIVENSGMIKWLEQNPGMVGFKVCPMCKAPIKTTHRYSDYVRNAAVDVDKVKSKLSGFPKDNEAKAKTLRDKIRSVKTNVQHESIRKALHALRVRLRPTRNEKRQPIDKVQLNAITSKIQLIERLLEVTNNIVGGAHGPIYTKHIEALLEVIVTRDEDYITDQEIDDASREINRLANIASLNRIDRTQKWKITPPIQEMFKRVEVLAYAPKVYTEKDNEEFATILAELKRVFGVALISAAEKNDIEKAMGFPKGQWFKCANGHVYIIGECAQPIHESKCIECGEAIGGQRHRLVTIQNRMSTSSTLVKLPPSKGTVAFDFHNSRQLAAESLLRSRL